MSDNIPPLRVKGEVRVSQECRRQPAEIRKQLRAELTVAEALDAAQSAEEFGAVILGLITAVEKAKDDE
jgi:hypothetical protein